MDGMVNEFYEPIECSALEPDGENHRRGSATISARIAERG